MRGQINTALTFGTLNPADITAATPLESEISKLEKQLADKRNQRDILYNGMWDKVKRVRAGVKANYGDDSQQYEMVGGTRMSERKPRARRTITSVTARSERSKQFSGLERIRPYETHSLERFKSLVGP